MFQTIRGTEERHLKQVEDRKSQERCLSKRGRFSKSLGKRKEKKCGLHTVPTPPDLVNERSQLYPLAKQSVI